MRGRSEAMQSGGGLRPVLGAPKIASLDKRLVRGWLETNERKLPRGIPGSSRICERSKRLSVPSLKSEIYAAPGTIDEEIYIFRKRYIPGPAKGFALSRGFSLRGE